MLLSMSFLQWLLLASMTLFVGGFLLTIYVFNKKRKQTAMDLANLQQQFASLKAISITQGKKLIKVSGNIKDLSAQKERHYQEPIVNKAYQQAAKMLAMGAEPEEIMECCDLTRGEVQLISQLNSSAKQNRSYH